ncbi:hypothetical protein M0804_015367 [Polistes exclamans]|nr:hypothetical protein M0804_015367 [Polistes exclamans]
MSQEQRRFRPDSPIDEEATMEQTPRLSDIDSVMRRRMEEIVNIQDILSKTQEETLKKKEEFSKLELELEYRKQRLALKKEGIRKSLDDMSGFQAI